MPGTRVHARAHAHEGGYGGGAGSLQMLGLVFAAASSARLGGGTRLSGADGGGVKGQGSPLKAHIHPKSDGGRRIRLACALWFDKDNEASERKREGKS